MDASPPSHPSDRTLGSFALGKLDDRLAGAVNQHLEQCEGCRSRVAEISADSFLGRLRDAKADRTTSGQLQYLGAIKDACASSAPPPRADTLPPGLANHPDYEIRRELGRGGMGVVYLAHNRLMGRDEVLKVMSRHILERPGVLERFLREIRAVARLRHPNIVAAYTAVRLGESIVFAMEYVDGLDLSRMVKSKGSLPVAHACHFVYQAALGLQHVDQRGLVHRDIKPGNLMLSREGNRAVVRILDFGLAKATREEKIDSELTSEGQTLGTPDFIAPEQILDAQGADIRSDIYSLGGSLYYLLTGRPPFRANSLYDIYQAHISLEADRLNFIRPEVPVELAAFVAKMMAKDPTRRPQTPKEVAGTLTPFFKSANASFKLPAAHISHTDQPAPAVAQSVAQAGNGAVPTKKTDVAPIEAARSENVIKIDENEHTTGAALSVQSGRRPTRKSRPIAASTLPLGLIALGVIIIAISMRDGSKARIQARGAAKVTNQQLPTSIAPASVHAEPPGKPQLQATQQGGNWTVEDSALVQSSSDGSAMLILGDPSWSQYDLSFEVLAMEGRGGIWTFVHFTDWNHHLNFYLGGSSRALHGLGTVFDGVPTRQENPGAINHHEWYKIQVIVRGPDIRCFLDGAELFSQADNRFTQGQIGLGSNRLAVRLRSIVVKDPDGKIMFQGIPKLAVNDLGQARYSPWPASTGRCGLSLPHRSTEATIPNRK